MVCNSDRKSVLNRLLWSACLVGFLAGAAQAQETPRFTFDIGGGLTKAVGNTERKLNDGWNVNGGAGINLTSWAGAKVDVGYNRFDINRFTLNNAGFPGGNVGIFSATLNPFVHLTPGHHVDVYLIGGGGLYRVEQEFTQPSATNLLGFDPFFGFYNVTVPVTQVLSSYSVNKPGVNVGAGIALGTKWHGKLFAESRYAKIFMGNDRHIDYIPITFGFRW
jgi:Outer membrane protein beta-barrel domain